MGFLAKGCEWVNLAPEESSFGAEGGGAVLPLAGGGAEVVEVALVGGAEAALGGGAAGANAMRGRPGRTKGSASARSQIWVIGSPGLLGLPRMCEGTESREGLDPNSTEEQRSLRRVLRG